MILSTVVVLTLSTVARSKKQESKKLEGKKLEGKKQESKKQGNKKNPHSFTTMVMLTNNGKKDGNSSRIFGKWKKGHNTKTQVKNVSFVQKSPPYEKSSTKSCLNMRKYKDIDKEIDMVPIDSIDPQYSKKGIARPATKSKASSLKKAPDKSKALRNENTIGTKIYSVNSGETKIKTNKKSEMNVAKTNKNRNRVGTTSMCMMTPDMMDTLGLEELRQENQFRRETRKHGNASNSTEVRNPAIEQTSRNNTYYDINPGCSAVIRSPATAVLAQPSRSSRRTGSLRKERISQNKSRQFNDNESTFQFADNDSFTRTSGSGTSYSSNFSDGTDDEPISRDPCRDMNYCYVADDGDDGGDYENTRRMNLFRNVDGKTCSPIACVSIVLSLPVACGLLCVDNVLNTNYFDAATENYRKSPTNSLPDPMGKSKKGKFKQRNHRGNIIPDNDNDDDVWNTVCDLELFPSDNDKNTSPCW